MLSKKGLLALVAGLAIGITASQVNAANPPQPNFCGSKPNCQSNSDQFMYAGKSLDIYNASGAALRVSGVWTFSFQNINNCSGNLRPALNEAIRQAAAEFQIFFQESSTGIPIYGNCGSDFVAKCGAGAAACLGRGYPYNVSIDFDSPTVSTYFFVTQVSVVLHELIGHAMATWNEQYNISGCLCSNGTFDFMDTGPGSRHGIFDGGPEIARWQRTMGSPELTAYGSGVNGAGLYLFACNFDHYATRLSILYNDGQGVYWSGVILPIKPDPNGCIGIGQFEGMVIQPGRCYYLKQENAVSWSTNINEVLIRCS